MHGSLRIAWAVAVLATALSIPAQAANSLPSWNDGASKSAIVDFVEAVTTEGSTDFVKPADRIAVFDNDGTLWSEQPVYFQLLFALDRLRELAAANPSVASTPELKAAVDGDLETFFAGGEAALLSAIDATHAGLSIDAFQAEVAGWLATARHPETGLPFDRMVYQPMLELLDYLRANDFATYIVSGGGVDFIRVFAEKAYGILPEQVIGSLGELALVDIDGEPELIKQPGLAFLDDKEGKPIAIARMIGKRPIFVAGNSDGDFAMADWSTSAPGEQFALFIHHTDGQREVAYDRDSHIGRLDKALDAAPAQGWLIVDMAEDWRQVWPD